MAHLISSKVQLLIFLLVFRNICYAAQTTEISSLTTPYIPGTFYQCLPSKSCGFDPQLEKLVYNEVLYAYQIKQLRGRICLTKKKGNGGVGLVDLLILLLAVFV
jgi:hypothetical protein